MPPDAVRWAVISGMDVASEMTVIPIKVADSLKYSARSTIFFTAVLALSTSTTSATLPATIAPGSDSAPINCMTI